MARLGKEKRRQHPAGQTEALAPAAPAPQAGGHEHNRLQRTVRRLLGNDPQKQEEEAVRATVAHQDRASTPPISGLGSDRP